MASTQAARTVAGVAVPSPCRNNASGVQTCGDNTAPPANMATARASLDLPALPVAVRLELERPQPTPRVA